MSNSKFIGRRYLAGLIFIIVGALLLLRNIGIILFDIPDIVFSWQGILIVIGFIILLTAQNKTPGLILILIGGVFLLPEFFNIAYHDIWLLWPIIIIIIGLNMIFRRKHHRRDVLTEFGNKSQSTLIDEKIDEVAVFSGSEKLIKTENFKGGNITAIFGGAEIDFRFSKLAEGEHVLDLLTIFGGTTLIIPNDWNLVLKVTPIFGGFSDERMRLPSTPTDPSRTLIIKGLVLFGGGEIKSV